MTKLGRFDIDWMIEGAGDFRCWGEHKLRRVRYPTLMISRAKLAKGLSLGRFFVFVSWPDGLYVCPVYRQDLDVWRCGGRYDRGDPLDIEAVVDLDVRRFRKVGVR